MASHLPSPPPPPQPTHPSHTHSYGDITPSTAIETGLDLVLVLMGVVVFGLIMGSISDLVAHSSKAARQAQVRACMWVVWLWVGGWVGGAGGWVGVGWGGVLV